MFELFLIVSRGTEAPRNAPQTRQRTQPGSQAPAPAPG
jgi:hypothetical protein